MEKRKESKIGQEIPKSAQILTIETVLAFIGITPDTVREDAYNHWHRFIEYVSKHSGANWHDDIRHKLRSWLGIDERYYVAYRNACLSWGVMKMEDGNLFFVGIPEGAEIPTEITEEQFREELEEENSQRSKLGKPRVSLEEWRGLRSKRFKPVG